MPGLLTVYTDYRMEVESRCFRFLHPRRQPSSTPKVFALAARTMIISRVEEE
jgi:hypothetical protein